MRSRLLAVALVVIGCGGRLATDERADAPRESPSAAAPNIAFGGSLPVPIGDAGPTSSTTPPDEPQPNAATTSTATSQYCPAHPTTHVGIVANLDPRATVINEAWNLNNPTQVTNFSTTMTLFDASGGYSVLDVYFRITGNNRWNYYAVLAGADHSNLEIGKGSLEFAASSEGALLHHEVLQPIRPPNADGSWGPEIRIDFGLALDQGGSGTTGLTSRAEVSNVSAQSSDGVPARWGAPCADPGAPNPER